MDVAEGVAAAGKYYYLTDSSGALDIAGLDPLSGAATAPIPVLNVPDMSLESASLSSTDGVLIVSSDLLRTLVRRVRPQWEPALGVGVPHRLVLRPAGTLTPSGRAPPT